MCLTQLLITKYWQKNESHYTNIKADNGGKIFRNALVDIMRQTKYLKGELA